MPEETQTQDQVKIKITVDGKEQEVTLDEAKELAQKGQDYTNKTKALAEERKQFEDKVKRVEALESIVNEMETNPELKIALNKTYADVKAGRITKKEGETKSLKIVDKWIDNATRTEDREAYKELREAIKEETNMDERDKKIKSLEDKISFLESTSSVSLTSKVEQDLEKLEDELGKEFIDKYRKEYKSLALKYPNLSPKKILYNIVDDENALEEVFVAKAEKRKKLELERKKKGSSPGGEDTVAEKPKYEKDKAGRVTPESILKIAQKRLGLT